MFSSVAEAMELNSFCSFCGCLKFKVQKHGSGAYSLVRAIGEEGYCQWNHSAEHIYVPQGSHEDTMMIVRGG